MSTRALRELGRAARVLPPRRRLRRIACTAVYGPSDPERGPSARGDARARAPADQHHARRPRGLRLGRVYLPQDELDRFGVTEDDIAAGRTGPDWRALMAHQASRADALLAEGLGLLPLLDRRSALCVRSFAASTRDCSTGSSDAASTCSSSRPSLSTLGKLRVIGTGARHERRPSRQEGGVRAIVVGGGLAGIAAALDLVDAGHGHVARGAPDSWRRRPDAAGARRRSASSAGQRPARGAGLLH